MRYYLNIVLLFLLYMPLGVKGQDPHFTQFYATPQLINPAYAGVFNGSFRIGTTYRQQWSSLGAPFNSMAVALDGKVLNDGVYHQNPFNLGLVVQSDKTLKGSLSSNNLSGIAAYHVPLNREGTQSIGIGLSAMYGQRNFNFTNLVAASQFASGGFDLSIPSGEVTFEKMKPYLSLGAGILYCNTNEEEGSFFEIGASAYHLNRPLQSILYEGTAVIPMRVSAHAYLQRYVGDDLLLEGRLLYQIQTESDYLLGGAAITKLLESDPEGSLLGIGCWYRTGDAIAPNVFAEFKSMRIGFTYDIQINDIRKASIPVSTLEFSLRYRFKSKW